MSVFRVRSLIPLAVSATQSRIEANITNDYDIENADESVAFSVLITHRRNATSSEVLSNALQRALYIVSSQSESASTKGRVNKIVVRKEHQSTNRAESRGCKSRRK